LLGIINNVLDLARHQAGRLELNAQTVEMAEILQTAVAEIRDDCERNALTLTTSIATDCPSVYGDPIRLQQIVHNLLSNAVKFTKPGGAITLTAGDAAEDGFVRVQISDTGIGMSADQVPTALAEFGQVDSRLERRYEGTGLGLPLSKSLVELHGGIFNIASMPGQGTTITLLLPRDADTAARAAAARTAAPKRLALVA
jgi:signal transduction histidine kinase